MSEEAEKRHPPQEADVLPWKVLAIVFVATLVISVSFGGWGCAVAHRLGPPMGDPRPDAAEPVPLVRSSLEREIFREWPTEFPRRRAADRKRLNEWGWIDRRRGLVHMPIDVAMRIHLGESPQETAAR